MAKNPYSLLSQSNLQSPEDLAALGSYALQSGLVTPDQAMGDVNSVLKFLQGSKKKSPVLSAKKMALEADQLQQAGQTGTVNVPSPQPGVYEKKTVNLPAPIAKGSGLSMTNVEKTNQEDQNVDKGGSRSTTQNMLTMSPEQFNDLYQTAMRSPAFQSQQQGIENQEDLLRLTVEAPTDYLSNPIEALLASEFGRKGPTGRVANTPLETRAALLSGMGKLQDDRRDITKQAIEAVKSQKSGSMTEVLYNDWLRKNTFGADTAETGRAQDPTQGKGASGGLSQNALLSDIRIKEKDARDSINKTMEPLEQGYTQLKNAEEALAKNDYQSTMGILSILAKNVGADAGALSNQDLNRWLPRTFEGDLSKASAYFSSNPNEPVPPELTTGLRELVKLAARNMAKRYGDNLARKKGQYKGSSSFKNVPIDDISRPAESMIKELTSKGSIAAPKKAAPAPQRKKALEDMTDAELDAYEAKLKGGK